MDISSFVSPSTLWFVLGCVLIALEMTLVYLNGALMIMGIGFFATALLTYLVGIPFSAQLVMLAVFVALSFFGSRYILKQFPQKNAVDLNDRDAQLVSKTFTLHTAITDGAGTIKIGDALYTVYGNDAPAGGKVVIRARKGMGFEVEPPAA